MNNYAGITADVILKGVIPAPSLTEDTDKTEIRRSRPAGKKL